VEPPQAHRCIEIVLPMHTGWTLIRCSCGVDIQCPLGAAHDYTNAYMKHVLEATSANVGSKAPESTHASAQVGCQTPETPHLPTCEDCEQYYGLSLILARKHWREISPDGLATLCPNCIARRAAKLPGVVGLIGFLDRGGDKPWPYDLVNECVERLEATSVPDAARENNHE
jgi:hypothetical protein